MRWGMNHSLLPTLTSVHSSLCRQRFSLRKRELISGASSTQYLCCTDYLNIQLSPAPRVLFFISSHPSQQALPLVKASFSPLLTYPFWQLCSLPHTFHSNNLILLSRTTIILFFLWAFKGSSVLTRTRICHTQKPTKSDGFYTKGRVSQYQADSKMESKALLQCRHPPLKSLFC